MLEPTLATIEAAFADAPRPPDDELLHERCSDDNDNRYDDPGLCAFARSKLELLDERQLAATVAFLEAVRDIGDEYVAAEAAAALAGR